MSMYIWGGTSPVSPMLVDPWAALDGRLNAPAGTAQYPTLVNGYPIASPPNARMRWPNTIAAQPPWMIPGVDYYVGCPAIALIDISVSQPVGTTYTGGAAPHVDTTQANVVIDGYDFTTQSGIVLNSTFDNLVVRNCKFGGVNYVNNNPRQIIFQSGSGLIVRYCNIDGGTGGVEGLVNGATTQVWYQGTGDCIMEYNWWTNWSAHIIQIEVAGGWTGTYRFRYNFIDTCTEYVGAHMNMLEWDVPNNVNTGSCDWSFNAQQQQGPSGGEGPQFEGPNNAAILTPNLSNNVFVCFGGPGPGVGQWQAAQVHGCNPGLGQTVTAPAKLRQNYFDSRGAAINFYGGSFVAWTDISGNIDMPTGNVVVPT